MVLVTGSTGHLGSHVLFELSKAGIPVTALYRDDHKKELVKTLFSNYAGSDSGLFDEIYWIKGEINDAWLLNEVLKNVTHVIHAAGYVSFSDSDRALLHQINHIGTATLVNASLESGVKRFCHVSSIATMGEPADDGMIAEDVIWNQDESASAYASSKFKGEMEVWRGIYEGLSAVIVNPSVIVGPGMWTGPGKSLFNSVKSGLRYYPSGSTGFVDVRDVASILVKLCFTDIESERFILNAENLSHQAFLSCLARSMNKPVPKVKVTAFLSGLAVFIESIRAGITGDTPRITKRTMKIAEEKLSYSSEKIRLRLGVEFLPIEQSVNDAISLYKRLYNNIL